YLIAQNTRGGARRDQPSAAERLWLIQHVVLVVPLVREARGLQEIGRHAVRLERFCRARDEAREVHQLLRELALLSRIQDAEIHGGRIDRRRIDSALSED